MPNLLSLSMNKVILQSFNWNSHTQATFTKNLRKNVRNIKESGITTIWLPPMSRSRDPEGYYPLDYYDFDSCYGTLKDLKELAKVCKEEEVELMYDLVCWYEFHGYKRRDYAFCGRERKIDSQELFGEFKEFTKYLREELNIQGIRMDYLIGEPANELGVYLANENPEGLFVGELWDTMNYSGTVLEYDQDRHRQQIVDYIDKTKGVFHVFDFTTKGILQTALTKKELWRMIDAQGRPPGVLGWYPEKAVSFIDNHDTLGQHLWAFSYNRDVILAGYVYILFHPGTPCIYIDHYNELQHELTYLLQIREEYEPKDVVILEAMAERYTMCLNEQLIILIGGDVHYQGECLWHSGMAAIYKK